MLVQLKLLIRQLASVFLMLSVLQGCGESAEDDFTPLPSAEDVGAVSQAANPNPGEQQPGLGKLVYDTPPNMTLKVPERIDVKIGRASVSDDVMAGKGKQQSEKIRITQAMSVTLCCGETENDPFKIRALSSEKQAVDHQQLGEDEFTQWSFEVTPLKKGQHSLELRVMRYFDDGNTIDSLIVREINIQVDATIMARTAAATYWPWLGLLLLLLLLYRISKNRRKRRSRSGAESVFISYRRSDSSGYTLAIYEKLKASLGDENVFMDMDDIPHGENFITHIEKVLESAGTALIMIGTGWLDAENEGGRRLDDPSDLVRQEVATALAKGLRVIPVLLKGAQMPNTEDLPEELKELSRLNALKIYDDQFEASVERLIASLEQE